MTPIQYTVLCIAAIPFIYYLLAIHSSLKFFRAARRAAGAGTDFTPPVSNLKPVRGLDAEAFENFSSFCKQDYPEYELLFCTTDENDPAVPVIHRLIKEFPDCKIRLLHSGTTQAINDKIAKLALMTSEARYEYLIINDSDVRVAPDYFRQVVSAFQDPKVGGVTSFYVSTEDRTIADHFQTIGMISDFWAGVLVAWRLQGLEFALGPTMATTKQRIRDFGGFRVLENRPADDLLLGRMIAQQGLEMRLLPYAVQTVADYKGLKSLLAKRTRWMTVMRAMRPWGHFGLLLTWGLPWSLAAAVARPTAAVAASYLGGYLICRLILSWIIGIYGLRQKGLWPKFALIPAWDAMAFWIWLVSFTRKSILWRGVEHSLKDGQLVPPGERQERERARQRTAEETEAAEGLNE